MLPQLKETYIPSVPPFVPCSSEARAVFSTNRASEKALQDVVSVVSESLREEGQRPLRINSRFPAGAQILKIKSGDSPRSIVIETLNTDRRTHTVYYKQRVALTAQTLGNTTQTTAQHIVILDSPETKKALHDDIYNWLSPKLDPVVDTPIPMLRLPLLRVVQPHEVVGMRIRDVKLSVHQSKEKCVLYFDTPDESVSKMAIDMERLAKYDYQSLVGLWYVTNIQGDFDIYTPERMRNSFATVQ